MLIKGIYCVNNTEDSSHELGTFSDSLRSNKTNYFQSKQTLENLRVTKLVDNKNILDSPQVCPHTNFLDVTIYWISQCSWFRIFWVENMFKIHLFYFVCYINSTSKSTNPLQSNPITPCCKYYLSSVSY